MWTNENRGRYDRSKLRYPSDLTDEEWALAEPLLPPAKRGGNRRTVNVPEVVNGLMYVLSTGCQWRAIPKGLLPRSTVYDYFDLWSWGRRARSHPRRALRALSRGRLPRSELRAAQIQILVIGEVQDILSGSYREQRTMLNMLRFISNDLRASLVCFGVIEAREAIQGDVQLARRFDVLTMPRWSADETFEELVRAILRNQPMRERGVLTAKALRHIFVTTDGITAQIFRMMNALAIAAIESGLERITDEAVLAWTPLINGEAAFV